MLSKWKVQSNNFLIGLVRRWRVGHAPANQKGSEFEGHITRLQHALYDEKKFFRCNSFRARIVKFYRLIRVVVSGRIRAPTRARYTAILINRRYTVIFRVIRQQETNIKAYGSSASLGPVDLRPTPLLSNLTLISFTRIITFRGFRQEIKTEPRWSVISPR